MLAIVIPYYKTNFFKETLQSLANQTNKDFKVYIGNDDSPKDPVNIIKYFGDLLNIRYKKFATNLGSENLTLQWDRCIALAEKEEWIMVLGDDDVLSENVVGEFYKSIREVEEKELNVIRFASQEINEHSEIISQVFNHPNLELATDAYYRKLFKKSRSSLSEYIFRKEIYQKFGFKAFPLAWGSDNMAWLDFSEGKCIYTINQATVFFRLSPENISRKNFQVNIKLIARHQFFQIFLKKYYNAFTVEEKFKLLKYYEQLLYKLNKVPLKSVVVLFYKYSSTVNFVQGLKFIRRLIIFKQK